MKRSISRILTTHTGSLPRPSDLLSILNAKDSGRDHDESKYLRLVKDAVHDVVRQQVKCGLDIVDDGEMGKPSFLTYVNERLSGFEVSTADSGQNFWKTSREFASFPEFYEWIERDRQKTNRIHMICSGPVRYKGQALIERDIANLKEAVQGLPIEDVFMPAISPSNIEGWQKNRFYRSDEEYLFAIASAIAEEYRAIVDAGFILQIDDPRMLTHYVVTPEMSVQQCREWAEVRIEALNQALKGIPEDRIRFHTCYGINMGPRIHDMELKTVVDLMLKVRAGAYSFEAANPRHEHEWRVWETIRLPSGKILIPGVVTHTSHLVEHPELVADRIVRFATLVGRENVIAGTDCGFATFASSTDIHPTVAWAKLKSLAEGARLASTALWSQ